MTRFETVRHSSRGWYWQAAYGVLLVVVALFALIFPFAGSFALGVYLAWGLIASGAFGIVSGLHARREGRHFLDALLGVISVAAGFVVLTNPFIGAFALVWAIGLWFAVSGVAKIAGGVRLPGERLPLVFSGIVDLLLFALFWASSAWADLAVVSLLVAISLLGAGIVALTLAWRLRGLALRLSTH